MSGIILNETIRVGDLIYNNTLSFFNEAGK